MTPVDLQTLSIRVCAEEKKKSSVTLHKIKIKILNNYAIMKYFFIR